MTHKELADRRKTMATRVAKGANCEKVALEFGVCLSSVIKGCESHGVTRPRQGRLTSQRREVMAALISGGATLAKVARQHGVTINCVRIACQICGVIYESTKRRPIGKVLAILRLLRCRKSLSQVEIAKRLKCTRARVQQVHAEAKRLGLLNNEPTT